MKGLTLIELLIAIAVSAIIAAGIIGVIFQLLMSPKLMSNYGNTVGDLVKEIRRSIYQEAPQSRLQQFGYSVFDFAVVSLDGNTVFGGNSEVANGDVYANGEIVLSGNAKISGNAVATGKIIKSGNASITGSETPDLSKPLTFRTIDFSGYIAEAEAGGSSGTVHLSGNGTAFLGPVYIKGDLIISGNKVVQLQGPVYVEGSVSISGNSRIEGPGVLIAVKAIQITGNYKLTPDKIPFVVSMNSSITVSGNGFASVVLYAPSGEIILRGDSKIYGSVIGKNVNGSGNNKVEYSVFGH